VMMKDRVGEEFRAAVAAVTDFGFFVQLEEEMVEGLVKAEALGPGARLDPRLHALTYPNGRKVRVGQRLTVRLDSVNLQRRQIDFSPLAFEGEEPLDAREVARAAGLEHPRRRRGEQPPPEVPGAPHEIPAAGVSAHPGFDRLRALAMQEGKAQHKGARPEKHPPRAEEKRGGRGASGAPKHRGGPSRSSKSGGRRRGRRR